MAVYSTDWLSQIGAGKTDEEREKYSLVLEEELQLRVGKRLVDEIAPEKIDVFESVQNDESMTEEEREEKQLAWLEAEYPDYKAIVAEETEKLKKEVEGAPNKEKVISSFVQE